MKKIGLLLLVLVLAMGVLGVGYAHWSGTLDISGTVNTGTFGAELTQNNGIITDAIDDESVPVEVGGESCINYPLYANWADASKTQDTGHAICTLSNEKDDYSGTAMDKMVITVTNAYPSYNVWVPVDVHCLGTIPIKVWYTITNTNPAGEITIEMIADPAQAAGEFNLVPASTEATAIKLHQSKTARALIHIHPIQPVVGGAAGAQPGATYLFTITIHYVQAQ